MSRTASTRTSILLDSRKVRGLRKLLGSRGNSEAVPLVIEPRLTAEEGLEAVGKLRKLGGSSDAGSRLGEEGFRLGRAICCTQRNRSS